MMVIAGKSKLVHIAVTQHNVWAVSNDGNIFCHSGVQPLHSTQPSSSWVALSSLNNSRSAAGWAGSALMSGGQNTRIVQLFASSSCDSMVSLCIDSFSCFFCLW